MSQDKILMFAADYAKAWSSKNAASVAAHFAEDGSLNINDGPLSVGRKAITADAQGFMTAFPDMVVTMDSIHMNGSQPVFHWTLSGTNTGPNGTGKAVRFSGYEEWTMSADGLIRKSLGHFSQVELDEQLKNGATAK